MADSWLITRKPSTVSAPRGSWLQRRIPTRVPVQPAPSRTFPQDVASFALGGLQSLRSMAQGALDIGRQFGPASALLARPPEKLTIPNVPVGPSPQAYRVGEITGTAAQLLPAGVGVVRASAGVAKRLFARRLAQQATKVAEEADPVVQKVIAAVRAAKPVRAQQEALYSAERSRRLGQALRVGEQVPGEAGFRRQLGALGGELPKAQFEPIRPQLAQTDIDALFNRVESHPLVGGFQKIRAKQGLAKLLGPAGTEVPTTSELKLLRRVFGDPLVQTLTTGRKDWQAVAGDVLGVPRALMASTDLSAPLRQGVFAAAGYPKQFFGSFRDMFRSFGSERAYQALKESIVRRPTFSLMEDAKLALTGLDDLSLTGREEQFMSTLAERIPVAGRLVRASNRAYTGFLTKLRADVFDEMLRQAERAGVERTPQLLESAGKFVNSATGRGDLGSFELASRALSTALFSPRLMASRLNLINPVYYTRLDPFVRKQALRSLLGFAGAGTTVLGAAKLAGAQVGIDPRSADFGKIKIRNTRMDIWGGFQQYPRIAAQLITGKLISSTTGRELRLGEGYRPLTRKDIIERFFESKANPVVGFALRLAEGRSFDGTKFNVPLEVRSLFVPMVVQDLLDLAQQDPKLLPLILPGEASGLRLLGRNPGW